MSLATTAGSTSTGARTARSQGVLRARARRLRGDRRRARRRRSSTTRSGSSTASITVHPLGGAPMGRDDARGRRRRYGSVFNYPGLHVADGSVMPGPVGPNPCLTIAALADRFADAHARGRAGARRAARRRRAAAADGRAARPRPAPAPAPTSLEFTEEMKGFVTFGEDDYDRGLPRRARRPRRRCMFHLTITDGRHRALHRGPRARRRTAEGYVECDALGGQLPVSAGLVQPVRRPGGDKARKRMYYRLSFADGEGHPMTLDGYKEVERRPRLRRVERHDDAVHPRPRRPREPRRRAAREIVATGILHIQPLDFAKQLTTFRVAPAAPRRRARRASARCSPATCGTSTARRADDVTARRGTSPRSVIPFDAGDGVAVQRRSTCAGAQARRRGRCCSSTARACGPTSSAPPKRPHARRRPARRGLRRLARELAREHRHPAQRAGRSTRPRSTTTRARCARCSSRRAPTTSRPSSTARARRAS